MWALLWISLLSLSRAEPVKESRLYSGHFFRIARESSLSNAQGTSLKIKLPQGLLVKAIDYMPSSNNAQEPLVRIDIPEEWDQCAKTGLKRRQKISCCPDPAGCFVFASQLYADQLPTGPLKCKNAKPGAPVSVEPTPSLLSRLFSSKSNPPTHLKSSEELERYICRFASPQVAKVFREDLADLFESAGSAGHRSPKELACMILVETQMRTDRHTVKGAHGFAQLQNTAVKAVRLNIDPNSPDCNQTHLDAWNKFTTELRGGEGPLPVDVVSRLYTQGPSAGGINSEAIALIVHTIYLNVLRDQVVSDQKAICGVHFEEPQDNPDFLSTWLFKSPVQLSWVAYNWGPSNLKKKFFKPLCSAELHGPNSQGHLPKTTLSYVRKIQDCLSDEVTVAAGNQSVNFRGLTECGCRESDLRYAENASRSPASVVFKKINKATCDRSEEKWMRRSH